MNNNELYHYGVLGMHWGVRKDAISSAVRSRKANKQARLSEDHKTVATIRKKKISEMSNQELRTVNNRLQLETQYKDLRRKNVSAGERYIRNAMDGQAKAKTNKLMNAAVGAGIAFASAKGAAFIKNRLFLGLSAM